MLPRILYGRWLHRVFARIHDKRERAHFRYLYGLVLNTYAAGMNLTATRVYFKENGVSAEDVAEINRIHRQIQNCHYAALKRARRRRAKHNMSE